MQPSMKAGSPPVKLGGDFMGTGFFLMAAAERLHQILIVPWQL
jgi:hypothetical protein